MRFAPCSLAVLPLLALLVLGCGRGNDASGPNSGATTVDGTATAAEGQVVLHVKGMH